MKIVNLVFWLFTILFLVIAFTYFYQPLGENFYIIGDSLVIVLSFLAFVFGLHAFKFHGFGSLQGKALLFLSLGVFFWFLGETTWGIYEIVFGIEAPVGSIADIFWLVGYPFFLLGLYYVWKVAQAPISKTKLLLLIFLAILICLFAGYLTLPDLTNPEISLQEKLSTDGYVLGDIVLLFSAIFATANLLKVKIFKSYTLIILSLILMTLADIYYMKFLEIYKVGNLIDLLWDLGYILLALGFFYHRETMKTLLKKK